MNFRSRGRFCETFSGHSGVSSFPNVVQGVVRSFFCCALKVKNVGATFALFENQMQTEKQGG